MLCWVIECALAARGSGNLRGPLGWHARRCARCREGLLRVERLERLLREGAPAPPCIGEATLDAVSRSEPRPGPPAGRSPALPWRIAAGIAAVAILGAMLLWTERRAPRPPAPSGTGDPAPAPALAPREAPPASQGRTPPPSGALPPSEGESTSRVTVVEATLQGRPACVAVLSPREGSTIIFLRPTRSGEGVTP